MKALICGISGQDGAYLASLLLDKGYEVFGTSRDANTTSFSNLERMGIRHRIRLHSMAPTDFRSVIQVLQRVEPEEVYNLSGQSSVGLSFDQPVETFESIGVATVNLLEGIRFMDKNCRFYNAGSGECFGDTGTSAVTEDSPFRPSSPYAVAKATAHWTVANYREAYGLYACTGILFNHESPLRPTRFVTRKVIAAACRIAGGSKESLMLGNIHIVRDFGWAPEYVEAIWRMLQQPIADDYIIATGSSSSLEDFIAVAFGQVGLDWRRFVEIDPALLRPADHKCARANPAKAARRLGWTARYLMADVVQMMVECEKDGQALDKWKSV